MREDPLLCGWTHRSRLTGAVRSGRLAESQPASRDRLQQSRRRKPAGRSRTNPRRAKDRRWTLSSKACTARADGGDIIPRWPILSWPRVLPLPSQPRRHPQGTLPSSALRTGSRTLCFFALLVSGIEVLISHPRFYWGETGNVLTPPLFILPIPASRSTVPTGYDFVLPDQNGWSRYLHFQAAWACATDRLALCSSGACSAGISGNTCSRPAPISPGGALSKVLANNLRFRPPARRRLVV